MDQANQWGVPNQEQAQMQALAQAQMSPQPQPASVQAQPAQPPPQAQQFMPEQMIVDANGRLANAMGNLTASTAAAAQAKSQYETSGDMLKIMANSAEPAKHWTGVVAAGLRGWAMRKERKKGEEALNEQKTNAAAAAQAKLAYDQAEEDKSFAKDLQKAEWLEKMKQKYAKDSKPAEWEYRQSGFKRKEDIERIQAAGEEVDPMLLYQDEVFDRYLADRRTNALAAGGIDLPSKTEATLSEGVRSGVLAQRQLDRILKDFNPAHFGLFPAVKGMVGKLTMFADAPDWMRVDEWEKIGRDRKKFDSSLYNYANRLIKERSGAAVTQQEFDRFKHEFPLGAFESAETFEVVLNQHIRNVALELLDNQYLYGMTVDEKTGRLRMAAEDDPLMTMDEYNERQEAIYQQYGNDDWRSGMPTTRPDSPIPLDKPVPTLEGGSLQQVDDNITQQLYQDAGFSETKTTPNGITYGMKDGKWYQLSQ